MEIPQKAKEYFEKARQLAQNGQDQAAIESYEAAAQLAPDWPDPLFEMAFQYLLLQAFEKALHYYLKVDALKKDGFYNTKTAIWGLEKEQSGVFPSGLYLAYAQTEWLKDTARNLEILEEIVDRFPDYAPAWKALSDQLEQPEGRMEVIKYGLECSDIDAETKGGLLINKALVTQLLGDREYAKSQLQAFLSQASTSSKHELAKFVLESMED